MSDEAKDNARMVNELIEERAAEARERGMPEEGIAKAIKGGEILSMLIDADLSITEQIEVVSGLFSSMMMTLITGPMGADNEQSPSAAKAAISIVADVMGNVTDVILQTYGEEKGLEILTSEGTGVVVTKVEQD